MILKAIVVNGINNPFEKGTIYNYVNKSVLVTTFKHGSLSFPVNFEDGAFYAYQDDGSVYVIFEAVI